MITGMIYDRTAADVSFAKNVLAKIAAYEELTESEKEAWLQGMKGCYNASDINRVQAAMRTLSQNLVYNGYYDASITLPAKTWVERDVPTRADWVEYTSSVHRIRNAFYVYPHEPELPQVGASLTWAGANAIEKNIEDISIILDALIAAYRKSGTFAAGEEYDL